MIQAGIIGASGYTGGELIRLLSLHPYVQLETITSRSLAGTAAPEVYGSLRGVCDLEFTSSSVRETAAACDVIFLALPHGVASREITESVLQDTVVIDLGADFRLHDPEIYQQWYRTDHGSPHLLPQAVYGLPELHRAQIASAQLIANPGCYTTASILSLAPLFSRKLIHPASVIIDAKSGVSGAGRTAKTGLMFCECDENFKAYGVASHRHTPEIEQELSLAYGESVQLTFTPHLVPMNRGILTTSYAQPTGGASMEEVRSWYEEFYRDAPFVRILPEGVFPETRWVKGSNYCDIGIAQDSRTRRLIVVAAIDNLVKGASGQAVENMNIRFGLEETVGLTQGTVFPA